MARRRSSASRSNRDDRQGGRAGARTSRSQTGGASKRAPRTRTDGRVDVQCPQCGAGYRVGEDMLDSKIECSECHRVFVAKTTAGRRIQKPDYTKAYIGFAVAIVVIISIFVMLGSGGDEPVRRKKTVAEVPKTPQYNPGTHPRAIELAKWARAFGSNNQLILNTHSDRRALAKQLGVELDRADPNAFTTTLQQHASAELLREMQCDSAQLDSDQDMSASTGSAKLYVTPKDGDARFKRNTRGTFSVTFSMEGDTPKVTSFTLLQKPVYSAGKDPAVKRYEVNEQIAEAESITITDSGGTRKVQESKPGPMAHWADATPQQREMADKCVADIITSADDNAPGGLFNRATLKISEMPDKQAVIPRVLNAMYERYEDPNAHNMELSQLNRAMANWTGFAVNYQVRSSGDDAKDKLERQSCVRQWFAFWRRYHKDLSEWIDESDDLEGDDGGK